MKSLKHVLDKFYDDFDFDNRLKHDPIEFPHRYKDRKDREVSAFIASCLAYGRVDLFKPVVERILTIMGKSPYSFLMNFDVKRQGRLFGFKYRFNESRDIVCLLFITHRLLERHASFERAFKAHYNREDQNTGKALAGLVGEMLSIDTAAVYGKNVHPPGLAQFFPSPAGGSACKRMSLFLRWMIRDRDIDFGIWKGIPKSKLVIPLDTHIARIGRCLGLTGRKSADWRAAVEITDSLKAFDAEDPLKYDFALCHHGISGMCRTGDGRPCEGCILSAF
ncbi:MAG TPA: TIGR02757 family protein [Thermodesulfovibrionales bacterium]|nr:TIGR02757 family protein [Thermodesulfovibrionales bacterium]